MYFDNFGVCYSVSGVMPSSVTLQDPGRVWPGKRMAGRMGATRVTISSLLVSTLSLIN